MTYTIALVIEAGDGPDKKWFLDNVETLAEAEEVAELVTSHYEDATGITPMLSEPALGRCPECDRNLDLGGNEDCPTCAAEPPLAVVLELEG